MTFSARRLLRIGIATTLLALSGLAALAFGVALRAPKPVGFQVTRTTDVAGRPFAIAVWYPTTAIAWPFTPLGSTLMNVARDGAVAGTSLPLVVISHGNGGGPGGHADLAMALAGHGFVVAAPVHVGDNVADQSALASATFFQDRVGQLSRTIDHMLRQWASHAQLDTSRVAAFGFSAGGATVLLAVGAQFDLRRLANACGAVPTGQREFVCDVLRAARSPLVAPHLASSPTPFSADPRIRAAVLVAPGLAFLLDSADVSGVHVPLQVWSGDADDRVPTATNADRIHRLLPALTESHTIAGAGHLAFLAPCRLLRPVALCRDAPGFDREAAHARMNTAVVAFLQRQLGTGATAAALP
jgi:predicted dienelactone hydrolase